MLKNEIISLDGEISPQPEKKEIPKHLVKIAKHLQMFISNKTENEEEQQILLKIAGDQFKHLDLNLIKESCNKCFGRGFTGYNLVKKQYIVCHKCFKQIT